MDTYFWTEGLYYLQSNIYKLFFIELTEILLTSRDPDELKHIWVEWRKAIGPKVRRLYKDYVVYKNESSILNKFKNAGDAWLRSFESKDMKEQVKALWDQIRPLYLQIHAYARFKLREKYGDIVSEKGPIPAHLLGMLKQKGTMY